MKTICMFCGEPLELRFREYADGSQYVDFVCHSCGVKMIIDLVPGTEEVEQAAIEVPMAIPGGK